MIDGSNRIQCIQSRWMRVTLTSLETLYLIDQALWILNIGYVNLPLLAPCNGTANLSDPDHPVLAYTVHFTRVYSVLFPIINVGSTIDIHLASVKVLPNSIGVSLVCAALACGCA